jgi:hypothetical protein
MTIKRHLLREWRFCLMLGLTLLVAQISSVATAQGLLEKAVATIDPGTGEAKISRALLKKRLPNGKRITSVEIEKSGTQYFLVRTATSRGKCQTVATPLQEVKGSLMVARRPGGLGASASCSGDPCSSCKFTYTGDIVTGCKCTDGTAGGKCNHTITTTTLKGIFMR